MNYKQIKFYTDKDGMFTYFYPILDDMGLENDGSTYLSTNRKRHLHINIQEDLQGKGLSSEIIKAFVYREGYRIIPKGRITNPTVINVLNRINKDPNFIVTDEGDHFLIDETFSMQNDKEVFTVNNLQLVESFNMYRFKRRRLNELKHLAYIENIEKWLNKMEIQNYIINDDGSIDVDGDVDLSSRDLFDIPFQFGTVTGYFDISYNNILLLKNSPLHVDGYFDCSHNDIMTLKYSPRFVGGGFNCSNCQLKYTLVGSPTEVHLEFDCSSNELKSLEGAPYEIFGDFDCSDNHLESLNHSPIVHGEFIHDFD